MMNASVLKQIAPPSLQLSARLGQVKKLAVYGLAVFLVGCASHEGIVSGRAVPASSKGYVAGRFVTEKKTFTTAFVLTNLETKSEYVLPFATQAGADAGHTETTAIELPPGPYRITHWIVFNSYWGTGALSREFKAPLKESGLTKLLTVQAGQVVFLGKFSADNAVTADFNHVTTRGHWVAKPITLGDARALWDKDFPAFSGLNFTCFACSPGR